MHRPPPDIIRRLTPRDLAVAVPGTSRRWWERRLPRLRELGLLARAGRYYVGRLDAITDALMSGTLDDGATLSGTSTERRGSGR